MVLFADGIAPGHGTSDSDNNSSDEIGLNLALKPKKLSSRRQRKKAKDPAYPLYGKDSIPDFGKENILDKKVHILHSRLHRVAVARKSFKYLSDWFCVSDVRQRRRDVRRANPATAARLTSTTSRSTEAQESRKISSKSHDLLPLQ